MPPFGWLDFVLRAAVGTALTGLELFCSISDRLIVQPLWPYADLSRFSEEQVRTYMAVICLVAICAIPTIAVCHCCLASGRHLAIKGFGARGCA